jgi:hypothetical protein
VGAAAEAVAAGEVAAAFAVVEDMVAAAGE